MKIFKYSIPMKEEGCIEVPNGAVFLSFAVQNNVPCVWMLVDENARHKKIRTLIVGTGHPIPEVVQELNFLGSAILDNGGLVFHIFSDIETEK